MRESCSCGAAIHTLSYRRILHWRATHKCNAYTALQALEHDVNEVFLDFPAEEE